MNNYGVIMIILIYSVRMIDEDTSNKINIISLQVQVKHSRKHLER